MSQDTRIAKERQPQCITTRWKYRVASSVLKAMTEVLDVFISAGVRAAPRSLCLHPGCSPSGTQLWVSAVTGQLIRATRCLSEAATASCRPHDSVQPHTGLWPHLGTRAYTQTHTRTHSDACRTILTSTY